MSFISLILKRPGLPPWGQLPSKTSSWIVLLLLVYFYSGRSMAQTFPYSNHTEVGVLVGGGSPSTSTSFTLQTFNGVSLSPSHHIGFTTGIDVYGENTILPLALGWRGIFYRQPKFSPLAGLDIGLGSALLENNTSIISYKGGFLFNPTFGFLMRTKGKTAFSLTLGYKKQAFHRTEVYRDPSSSSIISPGVASRVERHYDYRRMSIKLGLFF